MNDREDSQTAGGAGSAGDRLDSWKEIAAYLKRGVRTVRRWELSEGLPVHRHQHGSRGSVYAYRQELDAWWQSGVAGRSGNGGAPRSSRRRLKRPVGIALTLCVAGVLLVIAVALRPTGWLHPASPSTPIHSLAVLPLENLTGDPGQEYFADGLTDSLITELGKLGTLRVISRQSVMQFKNTVVPLESIAQRLKVDAVVEGSVTRSGNRVRVTAQLVKTSPEEHLWAEDYDRDLADILVLQAELARTVAQQVEGALGSTRRPEMAARPARVNPDAYNEYLKAQYHAAKPGVDESQQAFAGFQRAIQLDPSFSLPYVSLAQFELSNAWFNQNPRRSLVKARSWTDRALALDGDDDEAHLVLALLDMYDTWDWAKASQEFDQALALNPSSSAALEARSYYLASVGRVDEAVRCREEAVSLDPLSHPMSCNLPFIYYLARRYPEAVAQSRKNLQLFNPNCIFEHVWMSRSLVEEGSPDQAIAEAEGAVSLAPKHPLALAQLAYVYARAGREPEARSVLERLEKAAETRVVDPYLLATVSTALNEKDRAFDLLNRACDTGSLWVSFVKSDPEFDPLRNDPRWQALLRRLHLDS